jgi:hypothetical protein
MRIGESVNVNRRAKCIWTMGLPAAILVLGAMTSLAGAAAGPYVVFGYNDLGMHCMDADFSEVAILPPYNTFRAQLIKRGDNPDIEDAAEFKVEYYIPSNTRSADKTNFWRYDLALFGVDLTPDFGLAGKGLSGTMEVLEPGQFQATGIPIVPFDDSGMLNPYQLAVIKVTKEGGLIAKTEAVMPVSQELNCNLCHSTPGVSTYTDILRDHDALHGTDLENSKPVLCAGCHADPALGTPGLPDVPMLSHAMHGAHAERVKDLDIDNKCYACHPGIRTQCQRDVHLSNNVECESCHGDMYAVGDPARMPWADQPQCGDCHTRPGFQFEEPGKLYKDSRGHSQVRCASCHGSPHAITPTVTEADNLQAEALQGYPGTINDCLVCHTVMPDEPFFHKISD